MARATPDGFTAEEIVAACLQRGCRLTVRELRDLRDEGIVRSLPSRGGKGVKARYPYAVVATIAAWKNGEHAPRSRKRRLAAKVVSGDALPPGNSIRDIILRSTLNDATGLLASLLSFVRNPANDTEVHLDPRLDEAYELAYEVCKLARQERQTDAFGYGPELDCIVESAVITDPVAEEASSSEIHARDPLNKGEEFIRFLSSIGPKALLVFLDSKNVLARVTDDELERARAALAVVLEWATRYVSLCDATPRARVVNIDHRDELYRSFEDSSSGSTEQHRKVAKFVRGLLGSMSDETIAARIVLGLAFLAQEQPGILDTVILERATQTLESALAIRPQPSK